jgi:hypothetical protein
MKKKISVLLLCCFAICFSSFAQKEKLSREDKDEKNQARLDRINNKNDIALFRRQIMALKEYAAEKQKIPALTKSTGTQARVIIFVDTEAVENETKTLMGAIRQDVGENSTTMYEIMFDRTQRKIISVKRTPEAMDADKEAADEKEESATTKKAGIKKTVHKKNKDEDEDDDPEEEVPSRTKHKDKDED